MERLVGATVGSYHLVRYLGSGGFGEVFVAQQSAPASGSASAQPLVVKALRADAPDGVIHRLLQAAKTVTATGHVNVLPALDAGIDGAAAYIVMPYLSTGSIETLLRAHPSSAERPGISAALAAPIVTQVSAALQAAHAVGAVHGDLKPGNIFLHAQRGQPPMALVSDFGQAPLLRAALAGTFAISPNAQRSPTTLALRLAAPEQLASAAVPASDQFALAAITCLLLTGRYPQQGHEDTPVSGISMLSEVCAALLPPGVVPVLRKALAAEPDQRFGDITTFALALDEGLADAKWIMLAAPHRAAPAPMRLSGQRISTAPSDPEISYAPTGVALADALLARVERVTHGKAGLLQRAFSYVFIGGIAAVVNLIVLYLVYNVLTLPLSSNLHWLIAFVVAAEVSTMTNFLLNDRITFRHLPGHARSWWARCLRFHSTSAAGTIATLVMSFAFKTWLGMTAVVAEAVAIVFALALNFTMHHVWTYRHITGGSSHAAQPQEPLGGKQEPQERAG